MGTVRSLAEWARGEPASRDAVLALANQAVALQPAAEAVIQWCLLDPQVEQEHVDEGRRVERAYQELVEQLRGLETDPVVAGPLGELLERHLQLVTVALEGVSPPEGLGLVAGELVGLRDLIRRTARLRGRTVADVPGL